MAPHSSTLAWKIPWTEESGGLQSMGSHRVDPTFTFHEKLLQNRVTIVDRFLNSSNDHKLQALQGKKVISGNFTLKEKLIV